MNRRHWALAILLVWIVSLAWLVKREYFRPTGARLAEAALAVPPGALFYHIEVRGRQIGFASTTVDTLGDSIRVEEQVVLDVPALGRLHRTSARSVAVLTRALRLRAVQVAMDGDDQQWTAAGRVTDDTAFRLVLAAGADSVTSHWGLAGPTVVPSLLPLRLAFGGELRRGNTYRARLFDPLLLAEREVTVRVGAESTLVVPDSADYDSTAMAWIPMLLDTVRAFAVDDTTPGRSTRMWIDAQGHVVRAEYGSGVVMERSAFEIAFENFRRRDTARVARASAAPPGGAIVPVTLIEAGVAAGPGGRADAPFRVRLTGSAARLAGGVAGQVQRGDTVTVTQVDPEALPRRFLPVTDSALAAFLRPGPLVESSDPRILAQVRQILGRDRNTRRAAARLVHWVHAEIRAMAPPGGGPPGAVGTLLARRGDAGAQATLLVALARAAGLPARTVSGLRYANGRFYYHAWVEVYAGGWVPADPLLDQWPADAQRLGLAPGGLATQLELTPLIGALAFEVL